MQMLYEQFSFSAGYQLLSEVGTGFLYHVSAEDFININVQKNSEKM